MNGKQANRLFAVIILCHIAVTLIFSFAIRRVQISLTANLFLSEMIIWGPAVLFLAATKTNPLKLCRFKKIRISTVLLVAVFSFLAMPLGTLLNILSLFFVENTAAHLSTSMMQYPFWLVFFMVGVYGPISEELVFRGVLFQSYKKEGKVGTAIILSSVLFGLMHMNINQAAYAIGLGVVMALLAEAVDSIYAPIIFHMIVNGKNVASVFAARWLQPELTGEIMAGQVTPDAGQLWQMLGMELLAATFLLPMAGCLLVYIAKREGRWEHLKQIFRSRRSEKDQKGAIITIPLAAGIAVCLTFMILDLF